MKKPFLLNFVVECLSPNRAEKETNNCYYDESVDMVRWLGESSKPLVIHTNGISEVMTKKADLEKGEDVKDRQMWG